VNPARAVRRLQQLQAILNGFDQVLKDFLERSVTLFRQRIFALAMPFLPFAVLEALYGNSILKVSVVS
jgi:hypothetical protein